MHAHCSYLPYLICVVEIACRALLPTVRSMQSTAIPEPLRTSHREHVCSKFNLVHMQVVVLSTIFVPRGESPLCAQAKTASLCRTQDFATPREGYMPPGGGIPLFANASQNPMSLAPPCQPIKRTRCVFEEGREKPGTDLPCLLYMCTLSPSTRATDCALRRVFLLP